MDRSTVIAVAGLGNWHYSQKERAMKILCTNGLKSVMLDLKPALERKSATGLVLVWGATVGLAKEITDGSEGDLAVLTAEAIDELIARGKAIRGSRTDLARSGIGVAVRAGAKRPDIGSPQSLRAALLAAKSVAHSKTGQSGIYFPSVLERLGIAEQMRPKLVVPEGGIPIGEIVASGEAEVGIQQISELLPVSGIEIVGPLPAPLQKVTTFSAGVLATASDPRAASDVLEFIAAASRPLLAAKGLEPP
jgi:molybdate transport system substrate-binding protein